MALFIINTAFHITGVVWITCDVCISCLDSHSDGTHSLQRIHRWASDVMLNYFHLFRWSKKTHLHLGWSKGWVKFQQIFSPLTMNYSFNEKLENKFDRELITVSMRFPGMLMCKSMLFLIYLFKIQIWLKKYIKSCLYFKHHGVQIVASYDRLLALSCFG